MFRDIGGNAACQCGGEFVGRVVCDETEVFWKNVHFCVERPAPRAVGVGVNERRCGKTAG